MFLLHCRSLGSSNKSLLVTPKCNLRTYRYRHRAFSYIAPVLWNSLTDSIRNSEDFLLNVFLEFLDLMIWLFTFIYVLFLPDGRCGWSSRPGNSILRRHQLAVHREGWHQRSRTEERDQMGKQVAKETAETTFSTQKHPGHHVYVQHLQ